MADTVKCKALCTFTRFVSGYGMVHGDPDSTDKKAQDPEVPTDAVDALAEEGLIVDPDAKAKAKAKAEAAAETEAAAAGGDEGQAPA